MERSAKTDNEDLKAKMREALDRKQAHDAVANDEHRKEAAPRTHGPEGEIHLHRRKAGGGS
ncbi:MAG: DUF5302 domain-containing protein [Candidatus Nanopelagicales bacterium]|nr:DUF5302 domain-containing protein [Candidatus Nanopelagicales bacterium]